MVGLIFVRDVTCGMALKQSENKYVKLYIIQCIFIIIINDDVRLWMISLATNCLVSRLARVFR